MEDNPSNIAFMEAFFSDYDHVELICAPSAELGLEYSLGRHHQAWLLNSTPKRNFF